VGLSIASSVGVSEPPCTHTVFGHCVYQYTVSLTTLQSQVMYMQQQWHHTFASPKYCRELLPAIFVPCGAVQQVCES
jgi:hypothetical protein